VRTRLRGRRPSEDIHDDGEATGGVRGAQVQFDMNGNPAQSLFPKGHDEDELPPLTAEDAKARATRSAMRIEYEHKRQEFSMGRGGNKYDLLMTA